MAQRVRADTRGQPGLARPPAHDRPGLLPREPAAADARNSGPPRAGATCGDAIQAGRTRLEPAREPVEGHVADRHDPLRSPLPMTRTKPPSSERSSRSSPSASLIRRPAAYSSSSSARSRIRTARGVPPLAASSRRSTSADVEGVGQLARLAGQVDPCGRCRARSAPRRSEAVEGPDRAPPGRRRLVGRRVPADARPGSGAGSAERPSRGRPAAAANPARSEPYARDVAGARPRSKRR